jgi:hypothetical protein
MPENSRRQVDDLKQVQHWRPTNVRCQGKEFSWAAVLAPGIGAPVA